MSCGASSCQPEELSSAVELMFACTDRIVTKTCVKLPLGNAQLGGSVMLTLIVPMPLPVLVLDMLEPVAPQLTNNAANPTAHRRLTIQNKSVERLRLLRSDRRIGNLKLAFIY